MRVSGFKQKGIVQLARTAMKGPWPYVILGAQGDTLVAAALAREYEVRWCYPAAVEAPGKVAVPAKPFRDWLALSDEELTLESTGATLEVEGGNRSASFHCENPSVFALDPLEPLPDLRGTRVPYGTLAEAI